MSSGQVAVPFWVDMNASRISVSLVDRLSAGVQQMATPEGNRFVGRLSGDRRDPARP